jgi:hypothetical protein
MKKNEMRKEYDLSGGKRGLFYGKVDTRNPVILEEEALDEVFEDELFVLESSLSRIKELQVRLSELDRKAQEKVSKRIVDASNALDEIAVPR